MHPLTNRKLPFPYAHTLFFLLGVVPLYFLFAKANFHLDWLNHLWHIAYRSEYFKAHGSFPDFLNTKQMVGLTQPIFYGFLFYPLMGGLAILAGPHLALAFSSLFLGWVQFNLVESLAFKLSRSKAESLLIALLVTWSIFGLTSLFHRAAITEFFAAQLLTAGLVAWFHCILASRTQERMKYFSLSVLLLTLTAGTHPLTALIGGPFCVVVLILTAPFFLWACRRQPTNYLGIILFSLSMTVILFPWIYACLLFERSFPPMERQFYFPFVDSLWSRFFPLPLDFRFLLEGWTLPTPFIEAQVAVPLLIYCLGMLYFFFPLKRNLSWKAAGAFILSFLAFALFTLLSCETPGKSLQSFGLNIERIQFAFRLVNFCNLSILLMIFSLLWLRSKAELTSFQRRQLYMLMVFCFALGLSGMLTKLTHVAAAARINENSEVNSFLIGNAVLTLPPTFYSHHDYQTPTDFKQLDTRTALSARLVEFQTLKGNDFGKVEDLIIENDRAEWVLTNSALFPWNQIFVNGEPLPDERKAVARFPVLVNERKGNKMVEVESFRTAILLPSGKHTLSFRSMPNKTWVKFRKLTFGTLAFIALSTALLWLIPAKRFHASESLVPDLSLQLQN